MKYTLFTVLLTISLPYSRSLIDCPTQCDTSLCPRTDTCKGGLIYDRCGCCKVCAKLEWEPCGIDITGTEWLCDASLTCLSRNFPVNRCEQVNCAKKKCGLRQLCELNRLGAPVCVCPRNCKSGKWKQTPVCGKNGKQYTNPCELYRHECLLREEIGVMWLGPCKKCYFDGKTYKYGDSRKGSLPCEKCTCHHGHWRCRTRRHCTDHLKTCTVFRSPSGALSSTCPPGYWCRVQIPGIPDQGIPEVGVCVAAKTKAKTSTVTPTTYNTTSTTATPKPALNAICYLPPKTGNCRASIQRWYYNKSSRKCTKFTFGGCGGNANNFRTKSGCRNTCMRRKSHQLRAASTPKPTKSSNRRTQPTTASPDWSVVCKLPPASGPCRAAMPQWHYNPKRRRCTRFIYGGCGGNQNNFDTKEECKAACMRRKGTRPTSSPDSRLTSVSSTNIETEIVLPTIIGCIFPTTERTTEGENTEWVLRTTPGRTTPGRTTPGRTTPGRTTPGRTTQTTGKPSTTTRSSTDRTTTPTTRARKVPPTWEVPMKVFTFRPPEAQPYRCACSECSFTPGEQTCETAHGCYTEFIEQKDGPPAVKYGCIENKMQYNMMCKTKPSQDVLPGIRVTCCRGDMCSDGSMNVLQKDRGVKVHTTKATVVKETPWFGTTARWAPRCFDPHSKKFYGERAEWKPNDCTVCTCIGGLPKCVATVCRHPNCVDAIRIKGQCCPVCPIAGNNTDDQQQEMIKALAQSQLTTVLVSIKKDKRVCEDINSGELYLVGQSWKLDDCTTCYCQKNGKVACALQMCGGYPTCANPIKEKGHCCPVCHDEVEEGISSSNENEVVDSPHSCADPVTGDFYRRYEMWQQDDCTACICGVDRKLQCTKKTCQMPHCENPVRGKGRCCPVCAAELEKGCVFEGRKFVSGAYKLLADDCTLCQCMNSEWNCSTSRCRNPRPGE